MFLSTTCCCWLSSTQRNVPLESNKSTQICACGLEKCEALKFAISPSLCMCYLHLWSTSYSWRLVSCNQLYNFKADIVLLSLDRAGCFVKELTWLILIPVTRLVLVFVQHLFSKLLSNWRVGFKSMFPTALSTKLIGFILQQNTSSSDHISNQPTA